MRKGRARTLDVQRTQLTEFKNNMAFHSHSEDGKGCLIKQQPLDTDQSRTVLGKLCLIVKAFV